MKPMPGRSARPALIHRQEVQTHRAPISKQDRSTTPGSTSPGFMNSKMMARCRRGSAGSDGRIGDDAEDPGAPVDCDLITGASAFFQLFNRSGTSLATTSMTFIFNASSA